MFTVKWEARSSDESEGKEILDSEKQEDVIKSFS